MRIFLRTLLLVLLSIISICNVRQQEEIRPETTRMEGKHLGRKVTLEPIEEEPIVWSMGYTNARVAANKFPVDDSEVVDTIEPKTKVIYTPHNENYVKAKLNKITIYIEKETIIDSLDDLPYEEEDLMLLARLIYNESSVLGKEGMLYTGSVVLNRVKSDKFAQQNDIKSVIFAPGQYACTWNGHWDEPSEEAIEVAEELLLCGSVLPDEVVWQANFQQGEGVYDTVGEGSFKTYYCY